MYQHNFFGLVNYYVFFHFRRYFPSYNNLFIVPCVSVCIFISTIMLHSLLNNQADLGQWNLTIMLYSTLSFLVTYCYHWAKKETLFVPILPIFNKRSRQRFQTRHVALHVRALLRFLIPSFIPQRPKCITYTIRTTRPLIL